MEATRTTAEVCVQADDSLEELKQRFEQWRAGRRRGERIPEVMSVAAAKEARVRGVYRVTRALRLDYAVLKQRAAPNQAGGRKTRVTMRGNSVAP